MELKIHVLSASASPDCKITVKKKRKSWIEKILDYDNVFTRMLSAESMKDYYKEIVVVKSRELSLMDTIAAKWQNKLKDQNAILGRRLKFSVGHNHITITVGNPVTLCENFISSNGKLEWSISRCSSKDIYDWKQGVIHAVDNYCDEHKSAEKLRRDLRKALAKKYPEIFSA